MVNKRAMMCWMFFFLFFSVGRGPVRAERNSLEQELQALRSRVDHLEDSSSTSQFSFHGIMAGNGQVLSVQNPSPEVNNGSRGVFVFQPEVSLRHSDRDEFFFKFGFAAGNGVEENSPFALSPWAADTEDSVRDINGRHRDYLLTAWYKHDFALDPVRLNVMGGLIDATDYLDDNAFANDEYSQFMNEALVNGANVFAPSYDLGGAVRLEKGAFNVNGVVMDVGENDDGNSFTFYGLQTGVKSKSAWGEGNYRVAFEKGDKNFLDVSSTTLNARHGMILSCDQEFGPIMGGWIRFGTQDGDAAIRYGNLYSGGINIRGALWGRPSDNIGIGHATLNNGNRGIHQSDVTEAYLRVQLTECVAMNIDGQYLRDSYDPGAGERTKGWVSGLLLTSSF